MRQLDRLTQYAKDKVDGSETPLSLYARAQYRRSVTDSVLTVVITAILLAFSTTQLSSKTSVQAPAIKKFVQQELVASRDER